MIRRLNITDTTTSRAVILVAALCAMIGAVIVIGCRKPSDAGVAAAGGPLALRAVASTNTIRIGDLIQFTLTADHPKGATLNPPDLNRPKEIVVRSQESTTQPISESESRTTIRYQLTSFVIGKHLVASGAVECVFSDGQKILDRMPRVELAVQSMLTDPNTPLRDIKGLARWPSAFPRWLAALLIVAALAALAAVLLHRFLSKPRTILHHPPPTPPHEIALNALRALLAKRWIEEERVEPFYIEVSKIVRRYIEDRFNLRAPERTTEEFIREATSSRLLSTDHQNLTGEFLAQCDLVKFAKYRPAQSDMRACYAAAERLILETKPPEPSTINHLPSPIPPSS